MFFLFLLFVINFSSAEPPDDNIKEIIVEAHKDFELYVAPIEIANHASRF